MIDNTSRRTIRTRHHGWYALCCDSCGGSRRSRFNIRVAKPRKPRVLLRRKFLLQKPCPTPLVAALGTSRRTKVTSAVFFMTNFKHTYYYCLKLFSSIGLPKKTIPNILRIVCVPTVIGTVIKCYLDQYSIVLALYIV